MTITVNKTTYTLTAVQLANLKTSATLAFGRYYSDRLNEATESKLCAMGLLAEGLNVPNPEERSKLQAEAGAALESARYAAQFHQDFATAARLSGQAERTYHMLARKCMFLTDEGFKLVWAATVD